MNETCTCGCCEGIEKVTPQKIANRPGLPALAYRVGTHATFMETMLARLSDLQMAGPDQKSGTRNPLLTLKTRATDDPAIAFLDAWATVADVLTFYQERIANEGYLLTATERRSILELAKLVGYVLRPGVAASAYLAFEMEKDQNNVMVPAGARAQSIPGPGELPQTFETSEPLAARFVWNAIKPRLNRPQFITFAVDEKVRDMTTDVRDITSLYLKGIATKLKPNDVILFTIETTENGKTKTEQVTVTRRINSVEPDAAADRTKIIFKPQPKVKSTTRFIDFVEKLLEPRPFGTAPPPNPVRLVRNLPAGFRVKSDQIPSLLTQLRPDLRESLPAAIRSAIFKRPFSILTGLRSILAATTSTVAQTDSIKIYALRLTASLFGHNVQKRFKIPAVGGQVTEANEWPVVEIKDGTRTKYEEAAAVDLDSSYDQILTDSWIVVRTTLTTITADQYVVAKVRNPNATILRAKYGTSGKTTHIELADPADTSKNVDWLTKKLDDASVSTSPAANDEHFQAIRGTTVYAQSELLELADEPIETHVGFNRNAPTDSDNDPIQARQIELDNVYDGLESGSWIIVSGERDDISGVSGVKATELVMIAGVTQDVQKIEVIKEGNKEIIDRPGDTTRTTIQLANSLAFSYKRDTVTINANVVRATHGETRSEVLGGGDGSKTLQAFALKQSPLTYISATTPTGIESTLQVRVNDILWHESDSLVGLKPADRRYITQTDNDGKTTAVFGDGIQGSRLPTGVENVKAVYRTGIGRPGNVAAAQISLLTTRPLGVKGVNNPQPATGGADPEDRDQARRNAPLHLKALDRAVSVQDYADFARAFAGIGKARALRLSDGRRELVHLTIAGAGDIPIDPSSDIYRNLLLALHQFGDPNQPLQVDTRDLKLLVISAQVKLLPDYLWEAVVPKIRAAVLETFSFERRDLGQDALASEAISAIQAVPGVDYVDLDKFDALDQETVLKSLADDAADKKETLDQVIKLKSRILVDVARVDFTAAGPVIQKAQLAYLTPAVPDTLILTERTK